MELALYRDNPSEQQRSDSLTQTSSPTTTTTTTISPPPLLSSLPSEINAERKSNTEVDSGAKRKERPRRIIGDGNIFGQGSATSCRDRDNHTSSSSYVQNDEDQEIEAALALALPTSPITDAVPLREAANVSTNTQDDNNNNNRGLLRVGIDPFQTGLGLGRDWEACAAYVMLPPVGSVGMLLLEQQSDYVRFHAWQSFLLFTTVFITHIFLSGSAIISWTFLSFDIVLIGWLVFRARADAETLDRYKIPFFGPLASSIVDEE